MNSPELVFLHIPKAAGTSQRSAFNGHYGAENVFWIGLDCPADIECYPQHQLGGRFVMGGHKRLAFYPRDLDPLYCAILRDPVERAISLFGYYTRPDLAISEGGRRMRSKVLLQQRSQGIDPDSMLLSIRNCRTFREEISNLQCSYLSLGTSTFAAVRKSLKRLDHAVGTMSYHDRFHRELQNLLGWPEVPLPVVNRSRDNYAATYLQDEELVAEIRELNREDQKLIDWVEGEHNGFWMRLRNPDQRRRRLRDLPVVPVQRQAPKHHLLGADELWPRRGQAKLKGPLGRMVVSKPQRLFYMPTPGAADPLIKRMMLQLSSVAHQQDMLALGIDAVVEHYKTGLVLDDYSDEEIRRMADSRDYFRFAILYHPVARLVDIFVQRFVQMRMQLPRARQLAHLVADAQGLDEPDCELGISFRQFVRACVSGRYKHRLLQTQTWYLPWHDSYDRFYRPQELQLLAEDLRELRGVRVQLPEVAVTPPPAPQAAPATYADVPAGRLPLDAGHWREQLLDQPLLEMIKDFYAMDFKLYNRTANTTRELVAE